MDQLTTPLYDALLRFQLERPLSFHVPGHKNGRLFPAKGLKSFQSILSCDMTELDGLDDLHHPEGPIADAMALLKGYYDTEKSYFLINGSTVGNLVMILAGTSRGDRILVQRNVHKSVFHALEIGGLKPVFIHPEMDPTTGIPLGLKLSDVKAAIQHYPDAKAIVLTYPNYYGMSCPIKELIDEAHEHGLTVLIDEAHGAHFYKKKGLPQSSLEMGADLVVHSAHKTLPAMTMGSFLHINSNRVSLIQVEKWLGRLQSSSPSYPIMASLDLARYYLATLSEEDLVKSINRAGTLNEAVQTIEGLSIPDPGDHYEQDPFKLIIRSESTQSGYDLQQSLGKKGIYAEMADPQHVLLILGIDPFFDGERVIQALKEIMAEKIVVNKHSVPVEKPRDPIISLDITYEELEQFKIKTIDLSLGQGCYSAEHIVPYPPGIPLVMKGECFTEEKISQLNALKKSGARFQGNSGIAKGLIQIYDVTMQKEKIE